MQCGKFLEEHKDWQQLSAPNTAMSAKKVIEENDMTQVAIASKNAAKLYGLEVLKECINTVGINTTRFVIVSKKRLVTEDADKISICFEIPHVAGSLFNILSHVIFNGLNMSKIESRPISDKKWELILAVIWQTLRLRTAFAELRKRHCLLRCWEIINQGINMMGGR